MSAAEAEQQLTAPGQRFEVATEEIRGVPTRVWVNAPRTLVEILEASRRFGNDDFLVYEDRRVSFESHFRLAAGLAHTLRDEYGVREGDRVAIAMRNYPEWSIAFWAIAAAGAVAVPLNAWWTSEELRFGLEDSAATVIFADSERAERIGRRAGVTACIGVDDGDLPAGYVAWDEVVPGAERSELPALDIGPEDDATIFYTSGTTGRPKGAVGTHRNICTSPFNVSFVAARDALRSGTGAGLPGGSLRSIYLLSVPLFHATGCHSILVGHIFSGGQLVMMRKWDPAVALQLIEKERVTTFGGVPSMALDVLNHPDLDRYDTSSLRGVRYGGAPAPPELVRRIAERFGTPASNGYGMTETSALATMNTGADYLERPDSVGRPVPVVEVRIVDDDGACLPAGSVGELMVKGPNVVRGYWLRPEETAETFRDGWIKTGDIARVDGDGYLYIVDRAKDMVIRGGENVYSVEVEDALYEHPAIAEAAVIGLPHPTLGEEVGAVVSLRAATAATEEELREFLVGRLANFKIPSRIWFVDALPRNPAGKVMKRQLRDLAG